MALQIGAVAPDFEAETTEGKIKFQFRILAPNIEMQQFAGFALSEPVGNAARRVAAIPFQNEVAGL